MDEQPKEKNDDSPNKMADSAGAAAYDSSMCAFDNLSVHGGKDVFFQVRKPRRVHWSVAWADLMMTMFILFAVLFIYQTANREFRYGGSGKTAAEQMVGTQPDPVPGDDRVPDEKGALRLEMSREVRRPLETFQLESMADLDNVALAEDQAVRIVLPADLLFDTGRAELKPQAMASLRDIAAAIGRTDDLVNVVGHTDNVPISSPRYATNWELSAIRACSVARFLIEEMKVPAERFYVGGYSYFKPVVPNNTIENRAENRRVEIILTKKKP